jgi:hypothetical protein
MGCGRRRGVRLAQGLKGLCKKLVDTLEIPAQDFVLD